MGPEVDARGYTHDLEEHLQRVLFEETSTANSGAAVLLVRGALADGNSARALRLAQATQRLAKARPDDSDIAAAAAHVRGLVERDSAMLKSAADAYSAPLARAEATEDAGQVSSAQGDHSAAVARLRQAYQQYESQGCTEAMARVRSQLRVAGVRLHHWRRADRPAVGWASLTETERQIAELVSLGLTNREVAARMFLSAHTVAFHLRHVFQKLEISSRVQLARLVPEEPPEANCA